MNNKIEYIEKEADLTPANSSVLEDMLISYEEPDEELDGSDLVVFEEDMDDEGLGEDEFNFTGDVGELPGSDAFAIGLEAGKGGLDDEGPDGAADFKTLDMKEWTEEWKDSMGDLTKDVANKAEEYAGELNEELEEDGLQLAVSEDGEDFGVIPVPGSEETFGKDEQENEAIDSNWVDNRDSGKFMPYLESSYPAGIPQHDGNSMVGCEVALLYLNKLNKEISEAIRTDSDGLLEPLVLEDYRVNILKDMVLLKERMNNLKRDLGDSTRQLTRAFSEGALEKTATTPRVQIVATPFERAVAGILINSVISAGHPFEDVYDYLNKKYAFSERDELSIMQLVMDSGHHIFKDRGAIGTKVDHDSLDSGGNMSLHGIDFIKNYFA
jgi:hypothetical protein